MVANKQKVIRLLKTARGQIDGLLKMVEDDRYCVDISNQIAATQAILKSANREILHAHIQGCVREAFENRDQQQKDAKIEEIIAIFDRLNQ